MLTGSLGAGFCWREYCLVWVESWLELSIVMVNKMWCHDAKFGTPESKSKLVAGDGVLHRDS